MHRLGEQPRRRLADLGNLSEPLVVSIAEIVLIAGMLASHDAVAENRGGRLFCNRWTSAAVNAPAVRVGAVAFGT